MRSLKTVAAALAGLMAAAGAWTALPAAHAAANDPFNPKVTFIRSTDAARVGSRFYLKVDQADGEQQIGTLKLSLPGGATDFALDTDIPGVNYDPAKDDAGNAAALLGSFHIEAYYSANGNPARTTIALDGTVYDDNGAAGCKVAPTFDECIRVRAVIPIPNYQVEIDATIKIPHPAKYEVTADISDLWNNDIVRQLDIRLKQLVIDLPAVKGTHTTFRNPLIAGNGTQYSFDYELTSAAIPALQHAGGAHPTCGFPCSIPLATLDYAPTAPTARLPFNQQLFIPNTPVTLSWTPSTDLNKDDPMSYVVTLDGVAQPVTSATTLSIGTPAIGTHTWAVTATDSHGESTSALPVGFEVKPLTGALVFTSVATNTDKLYVFPGAGGGFVYARNGGTAQGQQYGARYNGLSATTGLINYSGRFSLIALYDTTLKSAVGVFEPTGAISLMTGVGTGTTGA